MSTDGPHRPFQRRLLLNTASTAAGNLLAIVVALVSLPLLLGGLGRDVFGTWVLLQTFSAITGWLSLLDLGVGTAVTRALATRSATGDDRGSGMVVGSSFVLFTSLSVVCAAVLASVGPHLLPQMFRTPMHLRDDLRFAIVAFAGQVALDQMTEAAEAALEGLQRVDLSRAVDAARRVAVAVAISITALAGGGLRGVAVASFAASAVGPTLGGALLARSLTRAGIGLRLIRPDRGVIGELLQYGRTVAVLRPLGVLHRTMDRVVAGVVLGPGAVAFVEIATQVQNGADAILSASSYAVSPSASWLHARGDGDRLRDLFLRGTKLSLLVTGPVVVGAAMLAPPLVFLWVGSRYEAAAGLSVLALAYVALTAPLQVGSNLLIGTGRAADILRAAAVAVLVNLVSSVVLVHLVGIAGVFLGTLVGTAALVPLLGRSCLREVGIGASDFVGGTIVPALPPLAGMILAIAAVRLLGLDPVPTVALGAVVGGAVFVLVCLRIAMPLAEVRELVGSLRGGSAPRKDGLRG